MTKRILLIEDDATGREVAAFNLEKAGYLVHSVSDGESGLNAFRTDTFDLVITDVKMPGISGIDVLTRIRKRDSHIPIVVITAFAEVEVAVEAMKLGASDFLGKPFSRDHLLLVVEKSLSHRALERELDSLRVTAKGVARPIVYASQVMAQTVELADKFAPSDVSVLITGESGTGKELIARHIHVHSKRATEAFVPVNLAAIPAELLEAELFGHTKGAFTGANTSRLGKFRQAHGGTLFLDEVAELPLFLQGKLLRVLQEKVVDVLGEDTPVSVDVRVVAATNEDLVKATSEGRFREDLFYRINVVQIQVPPLRQRVEDIKEMVEHFISIHGAGRDFHISDELIAALTKWPWHGNVRELENVCQRLIILSEGDSLQIEHLPFPPEGARISQNQGNLDTAGDEWVSVVGNLPEEGFSLMDLEKRVIEKVLREKNGNVSKAAVYLRIPRHVLSYRMEKYGISKKV